MTKNLGNIQDPDLALLVNQIHDPSGNETTCKKKNFKKKTVPPKQNCPCAVKFTTQKCASEALQKSRNVLLMRENVNGKMRDHLYTNCSRPCYDGNEYCYKHLHSFLNNPSKIKIFKDVKEAGSKVLSDDPVFKKKERRKSKSQINNKNPKLISNLHTFMNHLLTLDEEEIKDNIQTAISENFDTIFEKHAEDNTEKTIKDNTEDNTEDTPEDVSIQSDDEEAEEIKDNQDISSNENIKKVETSESSSDEGIEVIVISTKNGRDLWYDPDVNMVIEPEDDDEGNELGKLTKVTSEEAPIEYENENYIVSCEHTIDGVNYYKCAISNVVYNMDLERVGIMHEDDSGAYKLKFD